MHEKVVIAIVKNDEALENWHGINISPSLRLVSFLNYKVSLFFTKAVPLRPKALSSLMTVEKNIENTFIYDHKSMIILPFLTTYREGA